ncbi:MULTISPECIES: hypothetical protein [Acinetobacter]|uniref:Uncharacterized protein n=1 Tax=Acinetobacter junii TaxID=40215 RepID=A0A365PL55_ACIJU|nr:MULTISPECIES: hypothetical protein [Acinetobacter]RBA30411.1 hypothetical protein DDF86_15525 [Acinetobacter junii]RBA41195.1 hypothetical protein DDG62_07105 [Acinetobacter junii]RBA49068.1 hypothetical protein DC346_04300 [Acinetobacter junii]WLF73733.1 hypothetical protein Q4617_07055 [Acinetobacter junii]
MEKKQHYYTNIGVILFITALPLKGWAVQPLSERILAQQTTILNNTLPYIIQKAEQDAQKPEEERWRAQRILSDNYLREIRIETLLDGVLSPYEEQKKNNVADLREKKKATIKPHAQDPDRFTIYEFESSNIKGEIRITVK